MYSAVDAEIKALFRIIGAAQHEDLPDSEALADANGSVMPATLVLWHPTTQLFAPWVRELKEYDGLDCWGTVMASLAPEARAREAVEALGFVDCVVVEEALERAYSLKGDTKAFRTLVYVGAWVTLRERFGVKKANKEDWISQERFRGNQAETASQSFYDGRYAMK